MSLSTFPEILREAYNFLLFEFSIIQLAFLLLPRHGLAPSVFPQSTSTSPCQNVCKRH